MEQKIHKCYINDRVKKIIDKRLQEDRKVKITECQLNNKESLFVVEENGQGLVLKKLKNR